jgi:hypothetical protein
MPTACQLQWVCGRASKGKENKQTNYTGPSPIICLRPNITYLYLHHMCFILSDLKCYGSPEIIFKMQRKRCNEKEKEEKKAFRFTKPFFFFGESFLLSNLIIFLFLIHFK